MESLTLTNYCFLKINCIILLQNNLPANWIGNWKAKKEIKRMFWLIGFVILNFKFERDSNAKVSNLWWKIFLSFWCMVESFFWLIDARHLLLIGFEKESDWFRRGLKFRRLKFGLKSLTKVPPTLLESN